MVSPVIAVGMVGDLEAEVGDGLDAAVPTIALPPSLALLTKSGPGLFLAAAADMPRAFHDLRSVARPQPGTLDLTLAWTAATAS